MGVGPRPLTEILHTLGEELGDYAGSKLTDRGLELRLEERVRAVTATKVYLQNGEEIETATVVSTVGTAPNKTVKKLCETYQIEKQWDRIIVDEYLKVPGHDGLWSAGDCAIVPLADGGGDPCPQTAQFAMRQGINLAENIGHEIQNEKLKPFLFKGLGELASIGHRTAVASIMGMQFSGFIAWFMWRSIYLSKLPGLDRKLRVMIDWTLDLFFPRDINLLSPRYTSLFRKVHLEPDDILFNRGEPAFSLYVVQKGQIELRDQDGITVRTLNEGDYFGERALVHGGGYIYDAVSNGQTELVSLSGEAVLPFFQSSRRFRRILAKTTAQVSAEAEVEAVVRNLNTKTLGRPVTSVMRTDVATLSRDQTVRDALILFKQRRYSVYPLVSEDRKLTGVLSREDFFDFIKRGDVDEDSKLDRIAIMHLPICREDATVGEAIEDMVRAGRYKCVILDDHERLLGLLTIMDLLGDEAAEEALARKE